MRNAILAGAASFAHLIGGRQAAKPRAEEREEDDKEEKKSKRAGDGDEDEDDKDEKKAKRADDSEDEDEARAEADEDGDDDKDEKKSKKSKRAKDGDEECDDDGEMKGRQAERARWASVLGDKAAAGHVAAACTLLASSDLAAKDVLALVQKMPVEGKGPGLAGRMADLNLPNPGDGGGELSGGAHDPKAVAARILAVVEKVQGKRA